MAATNDTIDGLLAEFRGYSAGMPPSYHVTMSWAGFRKMLDRFDAAHKREQGNAAKLREAIEDLFAKGCVSRHDRVAVCPPCIDNEGYSPSNEWCARCSSDVKEKCMAIYNARAALAAPARNCDVYNNESCRMAYHLHGYGLMTMQAFADWLFAPATEKEGGAK